MYTHTYVYTYIEPMATHWKGLLQRECTIVAAVVGDATGREVEFATRTPGQV